MEGGGSGTAARAVARPVRLDAAQRRHRRPLNDLHAWEEILVLGRKLSSGGRQHLRGYLHRVYTDIAAASSVLFLPAIGRVTTG